jgi:hypothetical protein
VVPSSVVSVVPSSVVSVAPEWSVIRVAHVRWSSGSVFRVVPSVSSRQGASCRSLRGRSSRVARISCQDVLPFRMCFPSSVLVLIRAGHQSLPSAQSSDVPSVSDDSVSAHPLIRLLGFLLCLVWYAALRTLVSLLSPHARVLSHFLASLSILH